MKPTGKDKYFEVRKSETISSRGKRGYAHHEHSKTRKLTNKGTDGWGYLWTRLGGGSIFVRREQTSLNKIQCKGGSIF